MMNAQVQGHDQAHASVIRFEGRSRAEAKRTALTFWIENQDSLSMSLREFLEACRTSGEGTEILFCKPAPSRFGEKFLRAFLR